MIEEAGLVKGKDVVVVVVVGFYGGWGGFLVLVFAAGRRKGCR